MIQFNFFKDEISCIKNKLCKLYNCSLEEINKAYSDLKEYKLNYINKELVIQCNKNANIVCRHWSTSIDNEKYIKANGLLSIEKLLERKDSPIYNILKQNNIFVDLNKIGVKISKEDKLDNLSKEFSNLYYICEKLKNYCDRERNAFIWYPHGYKLYSCINKCPEFFSTLSLDINNQFFIDNIKKIYSNGEEIHYEFVLPVNQIYDDELVLFNALKRKEDYFNYIDNNYDKNINENEMYAIVINKEYLLPYSKLKIIKE